MKPLHLAFGVLLISPSFAAQAASKTAVSTMPWGTTTTGESVNLYTLTDGPMTVAITNYGAHVVRIEAPDKDGKLADVVLGYKDLAGYLADAAGPKTYIGATVGRYGNRIAKGKFAIDGTSYTVPANDKVNALHGGPVGFDRKVWTGRVVKDGVDLTLVSPDGDMGFPGALTAHVTFTLEGHTLHIAYKATTTKPTVVALTNHAYFNLAGEGNGSILDQTLRINADKYTPIDNGLIPVGELSSVAGTPFDFRAPHAIGERIHANDEQLQRAGGYDHNFVLNGSGLREAAQVVDPKSGRTLTIATDQPGVQFYSGNFLTGATTGQSGVAYQKYAGLCLETQHFPDSPNRPDFPSTLLRPGQTLHSETVLTFGVTK